MTEDAIEPTAALERIAFLLQVSGEPSFRARTFRTAARTLRELTAPVLAQLAADGRLREIEGIGPVVERAVIEALAGKKPAYLAKLESELEEQTSEKAMALLSTLQGDCHMHSDWSDGRAPIEVMAATAKAIGHHYAVLSDHSPRLVIARGLSRERLLAQIEVVEALNKELAPFRILTGIETDILEDGALDQDEDLLSRLDVVVGSVHSLLRMPREYMTRRMLRAIENPHLDILGHCTGRLITGRRGRPQSEFDAEAVFNACARYDKAVEVNCRPERLDPPPDLLRLAVELGCRFAVNTDAHTPEELQWQLLGCRQAAASGVRPEDVVNTLPAAGLLAWTGRH